MEYLKEPLRVIDIHAHKFLPKQKQHQTPFLFFSLPRSFSRNSASATAAAALRQVRCCWSSSLVGPFDRFSSGIRRRRAPARYATLSSLPAVRNRASELYGVISWGGRRYQVAESLVRIRWVVRIWSTYCSFQYYFLSTYDGVVQDPPRISLEYNRMCTCTTKNSPTNLLCRSKRGKKVSGVSSCRRNSFTWLRGKSRIRNLEYDCDARVSLSSISKRRLWFRICHVMPLWCEYVI